MTLNDDQMLCVILNEIIQETKIPLNKLISYGTNHRCKKQTQDARRIFFVLSKILTGSTHKVIAKKINICYTNVSHTIREHYQWRYSFDKEYKELYDRLKSKIEGNEQKYF